MPAMTYAEFWRRYLGAHRNPRSRALHYSGTVLALTALLAAAITGDWRWLVAAPLAGYLCAWFGPFAFEHNRHETFGHPCAHAGAVCDRPAWPRDARRRQEGER